MSEELEFKARAQESGKWGFTLPIEQAANKSVLTNDMPPWMAQVWTLNLLCPKWQSPIGGSFAAGISTRKQPLDNAVLPPGQVRLDYGVDSAMESVLFDYPTNGCTIQFHAATFRLYVIQNTAFTAGTILGYSNPLVGGFVTPASRGNVSADVLPSAMLTTSLLTSTVAAQFHWAPNRARAYRIVPLNAAAQAGGWVSRQVLFNGAILTLDVNGDLGVGGSELMKNRNVFIPLVGNAQGIDVETAAGGGLFYYIQWLLDIG